MKEEQKEAIEEQKEVIERKEKELFETQSKYSMEIKKMKEVAVKE